MLHHALQQLPQALLRVGVLKALHCCLCLAYNVTPCSAATAAGPAVRGRAEGPPLLLALGL